MTHSVFKKQALDSNKREQLITTDSSEIPLTDIKTVEISFYDHEVYAGSQLIASITHDHDDFITQRWIVTVNNVEIHRANTWAKCYRYITWHYKQGTLPRQRQETSSATQIKVQSLSRLVAKTIAKATFLQGLSVFNFPGSDD